MRYRRAYLPNATWFFTLVTHERRPFPCQPESLALLRQSLLYARHKHPFAIEAFVVLPDDHLHCIWRLPEGDADFSTRWMLVKSHFSRHCPASLKGEISTVRRGRREQAVWQRRFWEHMVRDERDFSAHCDYIHWNPVKHGYVTAAADWPHSSFSRFVAQGVYPPDWGGVPDPAPPSAGE
jgi:Transposase and inactivated derivatives